VGGEPLHEHFRKLRAWGIDYLEAERVRVMCRGSRRCAEGEVMGIDWDLFAIPKGTPRVVTKRAKRLQDDKDEYAARRAVRARDGYRCAVPGCRDRGDHLHHIVYRSRSRKLRWAPSNLVFLCPAHHALEHAGKITISGNADDELTITGDKAYLEFKL
jgi:hypothetical protein